MQFLCIQFLCMQFLYVQLLAGFEGTRKERGIYEGERCKKRYEKQ